MIVVLHQNQAEPNYCDSNIYITFRRGSNFWFIRSLHIDHTGEKIYYWKPLI